MIDYTTTADELVSSDCEIAVLPIGAVEQHGPHLPLCTDFVIAQAMAAELAKRMNAYLLPVLPISTSYEHKGKKGSVWMRAETCYAMLQDVLLNLREQGFSKVVLVPGHGGIFVANPAIRELNANYPDFMVAKLSFMEFFRTLEMLNILECRENLHACEYETSMMLYLAEEMVKKEELAEADCIPDVPRDFLNYASVLKVSRNGVWGKPSLGTKEKGEKIFGILVEESLKYLERIFALGTEYDK